MAAENRFQWRGFKRYFSDVIASCLQALSTPAQMKKANLTPYDTKERDLAITKHDKTATIKEIHPIDTESSKTSKEGIQATKPKEGTALPDVVSLTNNNIKDIVMISYSHRDRELAHNIVTYLRERGLDIWYDKDCLNAESDVIDGMAKAVENSKLILILFSQEYKDGKNTRMESEYAHNQNKKMLFIRAQRNYRPDGWLGLLLGAKIYIDLSGKYPFDVKIQELYERIQVALDNTKPPVSTPRISRANSAALLKIDNERDVDENNNSSTPQIKKPILKDTEFNSTKANFPVWSKEETNTWLRQNGIKLKTKNELRGKHLQFLQTMKKESPDNFYQILRDSYGLVQIPQVMQFQTALDSLPDFKSPMNTSLVKFE